MSNNYVYGVDAASEYPDVSVSIETITPKTAERMLQFNTHNRKPKRSPLREEMLSGGWMLNGATIVFAKDGTLLDGQNRLIQCIASDVTITSVVVRGIDEAAQVTMDCGVKRTLKDFLSLAGYKDTVDLCTIALYMYRKSLGQDIRNLAGRNGHDQSVRSIFAYFISHDEEIITLKKRTVRVSKKYKGISTGPFAALVDEFNKVSDEDAEAFISQIASPTPTSQPCAKLKEAFRINAEQDPDKRYTTKKVLALTIKAWNAFMRGDEIALLGYKEGGAKPENFPKIYGRS